MVSIVLISFKHLPSVEFLSTPRIPLMTQNQQQMSIFT